MMLKEGVRKPQDAFEGLGASVYHQNASEANMAALRPVP